MSWPGDGRLFSAMYLELTQSRSHSSEDTNQARILKKLGLSAVASMACPKLVVNVCSSSYHSKLNPGTKSEIFVVETLLKYKEMIRCKKGILYEKNCRKCNLVGH